MVERGCRFNSFLVQRWDKDQKVKEVALLLDLHGLCAEDFTPCTTNLLVRLGAVCIFELLGMRGRRSTYVTNYMHLYTTDAEFTQFTSFAADVYVSDVPCIACIDVGTKVFRHDN